MLVALGESLAVVGLVVPGAAIMVAAGALIALGAMSFGPTLVAGAAGAILGDGISFWIGRRYRSRLRGAWPFSRHPEWLGKGERFVHRHGGKSVLFGRFVGPVRPIVPVVAGMLGMRPAAFVAMNVLSALLWAPAYLLPGLAVGASLALADIVAARLAVLLVATLVLIWLVVWGVRALARVLSPLAAATARKLLAWTVRHPRGNALFGNILDPARPEARTLMVMGIVLIGAVWLFFGVLEDVVTSDPLVHADQSVYQLLQGLRTPWGDRLMVFVTELGDGVVIGLIAGLVFAWLLWQRSWRAAAYWGAAIAFGQIAELSIKLVLHRPRPVESLYDGLASYAFPSGHTVMSTVAYGFLAVLIARELPVARRSRVYALAALPVALIAVSRLYLGAHWLSDVLGGLSLGLVWVCLLGIAYCRHPSASPPPRKLPAVAAAAFVLATSLQLARHFGADIERYAPRRTEHEMDAGRWWQQGWQALPGFRQDLEGELEQPLDVQWAGGLASLQSTLTAAGWKAPVALGPGTALRWLLPAPALDELPLLPQVHDGRHESLVMLGPAEPRRSTEAQSADSTLRPVLRLWRTGTVLGPDSVPLWVGSVSYEGLRTILLLSVPIDEQGFDPARERLAQALDGLESSLVARPKPAGAGAWDGRVLLIRQAATASP